MNSQIQEAIEKGTPVCAATIVYVIELPDGGEMRAKYSLALQEYDWEGWIGRGTEFGGFRWAHRVLSGPNFVRCPHCGADVERRDIRPARREAYLPGNSWEGYCDACGEDFPCMTKISPVWLAGYLSGAEDRDPAENSKEYMEARRYGQDARELFAKSLLS